MQKQQEQIMELLQELLPSKTEESNDEPTLRELILAQLEILEKIEKNLEK